MKKIVCILCTMVLLLAAVPVMAQTALPDTANLTSTDFATLFNSICDAWPADLSGGSMQVTADATFVNGVDGSCTLGGGANSAGEPLEEIIMEIRNENGEYAAMSEINYIYALTACFCEGDTADARWTAARELIDLSEALLPGQNCDDRIAYAKDIGRYNDLVNGTWNLSYRLPHYTVNLVPMNETGCLMVAVFGSH